MRTEESIRRALAAEFPDASPSPAVWERVKQTIPAPAARRRLPRLTAAAVWALVALSGGVAAATTPQIQSLADRYFQKTGIRLIQAPPRQTDPASGPAPGQPSPQTSEQRSGQSPARRKEDDPAQLRRFVPGFMKLPAYLPAPLDGPDGRTAIEPGQQRFSVSWHTPGGTGTPYLALTRFEWEFDGEATFGPVQEVQEVKIGRQQSSAYRDELGWHILWKLDGAVYHLQASNLPLSEAVKVASSLK